MQNMLSPVGVKGFWSLGSVVVTSITKTARLDDWTNYFNVFAKYRAIIQLDALIKWV
jgi:hypothetical protein